MSIKYRIKDIAENLNISKTTVSYIINGQAEKNRISKKLEKRVLDYVNEIKFIPSQVAKSLRTGKTNTVGLIVDDISNGFYSEIARRIEEKIFPLGYRLLYCSSENSLPKFKELIKLFRERQVDAYIVAPVTGCEESIQSLIHDNKELILFDRYFKSVKSNYVIIDNSKASYSAVKLLMERKYKQIGFVSLISNQTVMLDRKAGYLKAINEGNRRPLITEIAFSTHSEDYVNHIISFIEKNDKIDALFFSSSVLGIAGLEALKQLKKNIPQDLALVSFDDHILFRMYSPTITVIAQPIEQIADTLIDILTNKNKKQNCSVLPATIVIRESV